MEIEQLKEEITHLRYAQGIGIQEQTELRRFRQDARDEAFRLTSSCAKQTREIQSLKTDKDQLRVALEKLTKEISVVPKLEAQIKRLKTDLAKSAQKVHDIESQAATNDVNISVTQRPSLKKLLELNADLQSQIHKDAECQQFCELKSEQLRDAQKSKAAAEAEVEGFKHVMEENAHLQELHTAATKRINELIIEKRMGSGNEVAKLREQHTADQSHIDELTTTNQHRQVKVDSLRDESAVYCEKFLEAQDSQRHCNNGETYDGNLLNKLATKNVGVNKLEPFQPVLAALTVSVINSESTEPASVSDITLPLLDDSLTASNSSLSLSGIRSVSFSPCNPDTKQIAVAEPQESPTQTDVVVQNKPAFDMNPELVAKLQDLGKSIMNLSHIKFSNMRRTVENGRQNGSARPDLSITINVKPSDKKSWSLLRRVQSSISDKASPDIHGPTDIVKAFVIDMETAHRDHAEQARAAAQWQKVALEVLNEIEDLRKQLRVRPNCTVTAHRHLKDELDAKQIQYQMQEALMSEWKKRADQHPW